MDVASFLSHNTKRKPPPGTRRTRRRPDWEVSLEDAEKRAASGKWEDAQIRSFVGLYAFCHRLTYGVDDLDLEDKAVWRSATRQATRVLHNHFNDDKAEMVEFIKWVWEREAGREEWAKREGKNRGRLNVRIQFSARIITDYRVDRSRRRARR